MKNKKGFTLVELLSIITVLGIMVLLVVPKIGNNSKSTKEKELNKLKEIIASAAKVYHSSNDEVYLIDMDTLIEERYLTTDLVNPIDETKIDGCIRVLKTAEGVFEYKYSETCGNINVPFHADLNQGSTTQQFQTSYIDGTVIDLDVPTRDEYYFSEWIVVRGNSFIDKNRLVIGNIDTEIRAMWISWPLLEVDYDGGTPAETLNQKYKSGEIIELKPPTKEGYTFSHWAVESGNGIISGSSFTMGDKDTKIKAIWTANTYTISYVLNSGSYGTNHPTNATYDNVITIDNPTRTGYTFTGWTVTSGLNTATAKHGTTNTTVTSSITSASTKIKSKYFKNLATSGSVTLTANYTANTYTITFDANGGGVSPSTMTVTYNEKFGELPTPTREGFIFQGWYLNSTLITKDSIVTITDDKDLVASWVPSNPYEYYSCANTSSGTETAAVQYSGNCSVINDGSGNWRMKFLTSGTVTFVANIELDIFVVGGGGGNAGGGGYTKTYSNLSVAAGTYNVVVGSGGASGYAGGQSYFMNTSYAANGGGAGPKGSGGSGGAGTTSQSVCTDMWWNSQTGASCHAWGTQTTYYTGGSYGNSGGAGGSGQGTTTCEFGQGSTSGCNSGVTAYSGGGSTNSTSTAGGGGKSGTAGTANTGGGGGSSAAGGSGIVIIRNAR